ncbi:MAG: hypothetical protein ACQET8_16100 [Bacillota bacterium]
MSVEKNPFFLGFLVGLKPYGGIRKGVHEECKSGVAVYFVWRSYFSYGARIFRMALVQRA